MYCIYYDSISERGERFTASAMVEGKDAFSATLRFYYLNSTGAVAKMADDTEIMDVVKIS